MRLFCTCFLVVVLACVGMSCDSGERAPEIFEFDQVDIKPEPLGGFASLTSDARYPEIARRAGVAGRVKVRAIIDPEGNVVQQDGVRRVVQGIGAGCDEEADRLVTLARYSPAEVSGEHVFSWVEVEVRFSLDMEDPACGSGGCGECSRSEGCITARLWRD